MASATIRLAIPKADLPSLRLLSRANTDDLRALEEALPQEKPTLDPDALAQSIAARGALTLEVVAPIIRVLWRLAFVQRRLELTTESFLRSVAHTLREMDADDWAPEDAESLAERLDHLTRLLARDGTIASSAKAGELLLEQQLVFAKARTLTDLRPMFDERAQRIQVFLPFHTLVLTCLEGAETREIRIATDSSDIVQLREHLERAQRKEKLLRQDLTQAGVSIIRTGLASNA